MANGKVATNHKQTVKMEQKHIYLDLSDTKRIYKKLDDEWPESILHHVGSQSVSYLLSVQCELFKSSELR